ncbi:endolytic transglycosylase MltG [Aeribacillus composti]|uniref:Endolytic murein transglycosylase n=1 Tax=Aeribacillus composti TaxID=1868734 RepID=A0ABY9W7U0_9BACI|nr:endolytic transglycosylase MltG [Aeribacillus composti]WNF32216.1 endolytic transglycosylase MltG [Aeribacillus composti]
MADSDSNKEFLDKKLQEKLYIAKIVRKTVLTVLIAFVVIFAGVIGGGYLYVRSALKPVDPDNKEPVKVQIPIGSSVSQIASILEKNDIIKSAIVFKYYVKFKNESGFQAGNYQFNQSMTIQEIVERLKKGELMGEAAIKLTIPEGLQLSEIADIIAKHTPYSKKEIMNQLTNQQFIKQMQKKYPNTITDDIFNGRIKYALEGYLYPATYSFYEESPPLSEIIETMIKKTDEMLVPYRNKMKELSLSTHQFLTLASLVEEEATEKADREKIASVFYNRLEKNMPLQTDPTVLYSLGKHKERVYYKDLEVNSPYNTYKNKGLPPGPIANAGKQSLDAVANPADTNYFYFLATKEGEVIFTKTLDEHNKEKAKHITEKD